MDPQRTGPFRIGAVVVSFNTSALLDSCLASLRAEARDPSVDAEVWVVDNASTDGSAAMVRSRHEWARLVQLDENRGYAAACNVALRDFASRDAATNVDRPAPDLALVMNADAALRPGALERLAGALCSLPRAAVAGPGLVYQDGRFQHSAFRFPGLVQTCLDLVPIHRLMDSTLNGRYPRSLYQAGRPFVVDFPLGACMLAKVSAIREVGVMDEGFFLYCEEVDWCRRFSDSGYSCICVPEAVAVHHSAASTSVAGPSVSVALWRSRLRYFAKHEPRWRSALLATVIRLGLTMPWHH